MKDEEIAFDVHQVLETLLFDDANLDLEKLNEVDFALFDWMFSATDSAETGEK